MSAEEEKTNVTLELESDAVIEDEPPAEIGE